MKKPVLRRAVLLLMALLLALDLTVTFGMLRNSDTLDLTYGKGSQQIINLEGDSASGTRYYQKQYSARTIRSAALETSLRISDEGTILLKNDGILPLSPDTPVTPLGYALFDPLYCGTGSSAVSTLDADVLTPAEGLRLVFPAVNETAFSSQESAALEAPDPGKNPSLAAVRPLDGSSRILYEFVPSVLDGALSSMQGTVGVVYFARQAGEGGDSCMSAYEDGTPHELALTQAEKALLALAKENCSAVVAVICSASPMELACLEDDPAIRAVLWQGGAGSTGYGSVARILAGDVNPSGRLPFTFAADMSRDPTYPNQDDGSSRFTYANAFTTALGSSKTDKNVPAPFHEYEEGVYLGYRYYETAWGLGVLEDYYSRENGVVYPFGFGLGYSDFSRDLTGVTIQDLNLVLRVSVTNRGDRPGKDTVQVYSSPPYTGLDREYGIEKPSAVLLAFGKTKELAPGETQELEFTIVLEDLASYCSAHSNGDGTYGCYVLEAGTYRISVRSDSHTVLEESDLQISDTIWFCGTLQRYSERLAQSPVSASVDYSARIEDTSSYQAAVNRFERMNAYMADPEISHAVPLSRSDWEGTFPTSPDDSDRMASDTVVRWIAESDIAREASDPLPDANRPVSGADNGLTLADLRGISYSDPAWDKLLDQLTYTDPEDYRTVLFEAAYETGALESLRKPRSTEHDGPQGLTMPDVSGKNWLSGVCGYPAAPVMAATWNTDLLYELGAMVGQEALLAGITGWYAPGLNILRSPFCGRASEYYSEDPLLSGLLGARVVSGAGDNGLSCAAKHFCLMETEAHKGPNTCTWMTEQALREIYLRPFELVVKTARKTVWVDSGHQGRLESRTMRAGDFIMASDSAVGALWSAACPNLLTDVLRNEWGFSGAVISDMHMNVYSLMLARMLSAGCDLLMTTGSDSAVNLSGWSSGTTQQLARQAVKNVCYMQVNSALMQGISSRSVIEYSLSPWKRALFIVNGAVALVLLAGGAFLLRGWIRERKEQSTI